MQSPVGFFLINLNTFFYFHTLIYAYVLPHKRAWIAYN